MTLARVAEGVFVHQSEFIETNGVVVQGNTGVLVIDPGLTGDEMICLANDLRELGHVVSAGFSTHAHWDHLLWHPVLGEAPRYGTARSAADVAAFLSSPNWTEQLGEMTWPEITELPLEGFGLITALQSDTSLLPWDGPSVRVIEHDGHAAGHAALLIEDRGVLVAGDMLSDVFMPMLDGEAEDPIGDYLAALDRLEDATDGVDVVIPGHGSVGEGNEVARSRIAQDRAYLDAVRTGTDVNDPRIGPFAKEGWEWVKDVHEGQLQSLAER